LIGGIGGKVVELAGGAMAGGVLMLATAVFLSLYK
jgi:hypothetical protein